jgi:proteasome lid subunit RPN8/RPN11
LLRLEYFTESTVVMRIASPVYDEMVDHAEEQWPVECCGLLAGRAGFATQIYRLENRERSRTSYSADPVKELEALRKMDDLGLDFLAVYHSHPDSGCAPSPADVEKAFSERVRHVIISLKNPSTKVRAFQIRETGEVVEERIEIL